MELEQALQTFIAESRERLDEMEETLLALEQGGSVDSEQINAVFRTAHTIKGSAGLFGLDAVVAFTHVVESVLDRVRNGTLPLEGSLIQHLLQCHDHIRTLIDGVERGGAEDDGAPTAEGARLTAALRQYLGTPAGDAPAVAAPVPAPAREQATGAGPEQWHLSLRFGEGVLRDGMDPLSFLRYLGQIGTITGIAVLADHIPTAADMDPEACYLGFEVALQSSADKATIEGVFEFVRDDLSLQIVPPHSRISEYIRLIRARAEDDARLGEMLVRCGSVTAAELDAALDHQTVQMAQYPAVSTQPLGEILVDRGAAPAPVVQAALAHQKEQRDARAHESQSIRVSAARLDQLINEVGELVIAGAGIELVARRSHDTELAERASTLGALVEAVRDSALQLRMVTIGTTFRRFQRLVHDSAKALGKDIRLVTRGEDTELDKSLVEKIADPMTHLVRNAIDHGIEAQSDRTAAGKPAQGTITLNAYHDSGSVFIEVSDDGRGLQREKILAKAHERELIAADAQLSEAEIYALVFEPGFSTADKVTDLSGRGVGMDVVKRNIAALRGSVAITSVAGTGTKVTIRLPLTLAIIDGFEVTVGPTHFVIPLEMIEECVELSGRTADEYTDLRGEVLPLVQLRSLFSVGGSAAQRGSVVVVSDGTQKAGLIVDSLLGESQAVIKPMGKLFGRIECVSGSTILGSGEVALVLDVPALVRNAIDTSVRRVQNVAALH